MGQLSSMSERFEMRTLWKYRFCCIWKWGCHVSTGSAAFENEDVMSGLVLLHLKMRMSCQYWFCCIWKWGCHVRTGSAAFENEDVMSVLVLLHLKMRMPCQDWFCCIWKWGCHNITDSAVFENEDVMLVPHGSPAFENKDFMLVLVRQWPLACQRACWSLIVYYRTHGDNWEKRHVILPRCCPCKLPWLKADSIWVHRRYAGVGLGVSEPGEGVSTVVAFILDCTLHQEYTRFLHIFI